MSWENINIYKEKTRARVCGILIKENAILMVKHDILEKLWIPPGGGVQFGEPMDKALIREFKEETGLHIEVQKFLCAGEYINHQLHAIELFFVVSHISGKLTKGYDPEQSHDQQIISEVQFLSFGEINQIATQHKHGIFRYCDSVDTLLNLNGFMKF